MGCQRCARVSACVSVGPGPCLSRKRGSTTRCLTEESEGGHGCEAKANAVHQGERASVLLPVSKPASGHSSKHTATDTQAARWPLRGCHSQFATRCAFASEASLAEHVCARGKATGDGPQYACKLVASQTTHCRSLNSSHRQGRCFATFERARSWPGKASPDGGGARLCLARDASAGGIIWGLRVALPLPCHLRRASAPAPFCCALFCHCISPYQGSEHCVRWQSCAGLDDMCVPSCKCFFCTRANAL